MLLHSKIARGGVPIEEQQQRAPGDAVVRRLPREDGGRERRRSARSAAGLMTSWEICISSGGKWRDMTTAGRRLCGGGGSTGMSSSGRGYCAASISLLVGTYYHRGTLTRGSYILREPCHPRYLTITLTNWTIPYFIIHTISSVVMKGGGGVVACIALSVLLLHPTSRFALAHGLAPSCRRRRRRRRWRQRRGLPPPRRGGRHRRSGAGRRPSRPPRRSPRRRDEGGTGRQRR